MTYEQARSDFQRALFNHLGETPCQHPLADPNDWFAKPATPRELTARKRCLECPIFWDCRSYAIEAGVPDGTWGGVDERTRARIWRTRPGGKPTHFIEEMDAQLLPLLQARRDAENIDNDNNKDSA